MLRDDLRYSLRQLRKYPVFAAAAIFTLAVGIGPNAAMATIVSGLFRPLPVADPHQLAVLATTLSGNPRIWQRVAYPDYRDYRSSADAFAEMAAWDLNPVGLTADGQIDRLMATVVSGNYFSTLRLQPAAGRLILPSDGELGGREPIVVLGHAYWMRRFGGNASIVGRQVRIDGRLFTVVGVAPEHFHGTFTLLSSDAYLPLELFQSSARLGNRDMLSVRVIARLKPGMTIGQARASIETVATRLERDHPAINAGRRVRVYAERLARPEPQAGSQIVLLSALFLMLVGAILLIACANVLGLFLAKGLGRGREMAIRVAIGASRWDIVRLCLVEALVIGALGAIAGAVSGFAVVRALAAAASIPGFPLFLDFRLDWTTLGYLAVLLIVSTVLVGFLPAIRMSRAEPRRDLSGPSSVTDDRRRQVIRKGLAVLQIAGSFVLMVVCGLFVRSLQSLQSTDLGFDTAQVLLATADPGAAGYDPGRARSYYQSLDAALEALPGVESAAASVFVPFGTGNSTASVAAEGQAPPTTISGVQADRHFVTGDYFQTIGTPVLRGRTFDNRDGAGSPKVAVVNEALAARLWPGDAPLGRRFRASSDPGSWLEVVGIVRDARYRLSEIGGAAVPRYFVSLDQFEFPVRTVHVRSRSAGADTLIAAVNAAVRRLDPSVPVYDVYTLERQVGESSAGFGGAKGAAMVTGVLGTMGFLLALVGIYGVLSFTVRARTREIGIRIALGFEPSRVFRMLLREAWSLMLVGVALGLALSAAAARAMRGFLFGVASDDPLTLIAVVVLMGGVSTLVGVLPARRAARVNPIDTLRYE